MSQSCQAQMKAREDMIELTAANHTIWAERVHNKMVLIVGGDASKFMKPDGDGKWFEMEIPKLNCITKEIKDYLLSQDPNKTQPLELDDVNLTPNVKSSSTASKSILDSKPSQYEDMDVDFFSDQDINNLKEVSAALFKVAKTRWDKAWERADKDAESINKLKPTCWELIKEDIPLEIFNKIKAKIDYKVKYDKYDVVWLKNTVRAVVMTEQIGVKQVDYVKVCKNLFQIHQSDTESIHEYYKKFNSTYENHCTISTMQNHNQFRPSIYAAIFMDGLNAKQNAEFVAYTNNSVMQNIIVYPKDFTEAYSRCVNFKPSNVVVQTDVNHQDSDKHEETSKGKNVIGNTNHANAFVVKSLQSDDPKDKKTQSIRNATTIKDGKLVWKNTGVIVDCKHCHSEGLHLGFDCPNKPTNQDTIASTKEDKVALHKEIIQELIDEKVAAKASKNVRSFNAF